MVKKLYLRSLYSFLFTLLTLFEIWNASSEIGMNNFLPIRDGNGKGVGSFQVNHLKVQEWATSLFAVAGMQKQFMKRTIYSPKTLSCLKGVA